MYRVTWASDRVFGEPIIVVVGCGGTGGFVAEGICRLLGDTPAQVYLVDYDRVEEPNLRRQAFYDADVGKFKAQVLAERLSRNFGREVGYCVYPYSSEVHQEVFHFANPGLLVGCVDRASARGAIAQCVGGRQWWIDAGNGDHSGQVLIGNTAENERLKGGFSEGMGFCTKLPLPSIQQPGLLIPAPEPVPQADCAEAVEQGQQSPTINQVMASLTLECVRRLLGGELNWMGLYIDLEVGSLRPVLVEPETVARMTGIPVRQLVRKPDEKVFAQY